MQEKLAQVQNLLERYFDSIDSKPFERFKADFSFGKMLRSKLLLTIAPNSPYSTQMCAIIELIHFASLLHDDVIDSAHLRRGKQSINAKYGDKNAIMLGDILYSKAFYEVAELSRITGTNLAQVISNAVYELSLGELDDVSLGESMNLDSDKYIAMVARKTGALIEASAVCGGTLKSNSSLGMQFRTCENFGNFADIKSSLNPQNFHKYKSHTANTSIVDSASAESNETQNSQSNNRSNGGVALHCFDTERAKIGLGRPLSEVSYQNNANEYPRTNCKQDESATINIGIIGRVNVGKSSILNALLNKNRSWVSEVEGPVSDEIAYKGKILRFVDTAGIRRASKIEGIEKFALIRTKNILEQSNIVLLVLDSSQDFVELDEKISGLSQKYNLGIIILLNKWDIKCADFKAIETQIRRKFAYLAYAPILTISALKMRHIDEIKETILRVWENFNHRIPTATLNSHLKIATQKHPIPSDKGKIIKVYYATQVDCAPPTIMLSMNRPRALHFSYKRYLVNYFRANFDFSGVPIVILTKGREKGGVAE